MAKGLTAFRQLSTPDMFFAVGDGQTIPVFFLRELENALWVVEHSPPGNFRKRVFCTIEHDRCYGCERSDAEAFSGWAQRPRLYIDCVMGVDGFSVVMSQSLTPSALTDQLLEHYNDNGTIRDTWFDVTKSGTGKKTRHVISPNTEIPLPSLETSTDLGKQITYIPYEHQQIYLSH